MKELDKCWKNCLRMWKWIAEQKKNGSTTNVWTLKARWLRKHRFIKAVKEQCFFCEYSYHKKGPHKGLLNCKKCPGALVSPRFHCENYTSYHWRDRPSAFYRKLVQLDKKRRTK